jgi:predicted dehydrogenase
LAQGGTGLSATPKIALVGCGYWGKNLCRNFHELGALFSVVDASKNGQITARSIAPDSQITNSIDDVLRNDQIQGVALATPAETHAELSIQAMQAGKDVFVEKPMALTLENAEKMKKVVEQTGQVLMVGHLLEYHPAVLKLGEMIASGELGKIYYIYSNRLNFGKVRTEENALWSFAPHDVAVILRLMGQAPVEVSACGGSYLTNGIADTTLSNLRFENESRAHIFVSWLHPFQGAATRGCGR